MKSDGSERPDRRRLRAARITTEQTTLRRSRVSSDIRRQIVDAVMGGQYNGAEAARVYSVSEATVHRIVKAERSANPQRITTVRSRAKQNGRDRQSANEVVHDDRQGRRALTAAQEQEVVERLYSGTDIGTDLALEFGVHKSTISRIFRAARAQFPARLIAEPDPMQRQRRVMEGVARAMAAGRRPGRKLKIPTEVQHVIVIEATKPGKSFTNIARKYGVDPSRVARLVSARQVNLGPTNPQSLEEILSDLLRG